MRFIPCVPVLALLAAAAPAYGQDPGQVRANEPTTVTVRGQLEPVAPRIAAQKAGLGARFANGIRGTARKTWNGIIYLGGLFIDEDDVIPSERERRGPGLERK